MSKIEVGKRVYVESFDFKGYGRLMANTAGYHVLLDGFVHTLYFDYADVKEVVEDAYDIVIRSKDYDYCKHGGQDIGSVLFTFDVSTTSELYMFMKSRLRKCPYKITILIGGN